ncbi:MAG: AAA family ATPase [Bacteriovoracaceae bacterium]|nr:AAA family ATPase [Bacteriovoracaceae bacterium]
MVYVFTMNILICGLPGSGKTQLLAKLKDLKEFKAYSFLDLDAEILNRYHQKDGKLGEWIEAVGWAEFRDKERSLLEELLNSSKQVISLGGGALSEDFLQFYLGAPNVQFIWLECSPEESWLRIREDSNRPLVKKGYEQVLAVLRERERVGRKIPIRVSQDEQIAQVINKLNL